METGIKNKSSVSRSAYDSIAEVVDMEAILQALQAIYGEEIMKTDKFDEREGAENYEKQLASQFVWMHKEVVKKVHSADNTSPEKQDNNK